MSLSLTYQAYHFKAKFHIEGHYISISDSLPRLIHIHKFLLKPNTVYVYFWSFTTEPANMLYVSLSKSHNCSNDIAHITAFMQNVLLDDMFICKESFIDRHNITSLYILKLYYTDTILNNGTIGQYTSWILYV